MKKINILNELSGMQFGGKFSTDNEVNLWIQENINNNSWGKPERVIQLSDSEYEDFDLKSRVINISDPIISKEAVLDENNEVVVPAVYVKDYTIKEDYVITIEDITEQVEAENILFLRIKEGKKARECCNEIFDFVGGYNVERSLTSQQLNQMISQLAPILQAISLNMPRTVRQLLPSIAVDGTLVDDILKDSVDKILLKYGY